MKNGKRILFNKKYEKDKAKIIYDVWKKCWDESKVKMDLFDNVFSEAYKKTYIKKEKNKMKNFLSKAIFVGIIIVFIVAMVIQFYKNNTEIELEQIIWNGGSLLLLCLVCAVISKWIDVKKYQETWSRHSRHLYLMQKEMFFYIYDLEHYHAVSEKEALFVKNILAVWEDNQNQFCENIKVNESKLMDVFDHISNSKS